jgi:hypothetical protein
MFSQKFADSFKYVYFVEILKTLGFNFSSMAHQNSTGLMQWQQYFDRIILFFCRTHKTGAHSASRRKKRLQKL